MNKLYVWKKLNKKTRKYNYEFGINGTSFHFKADSWVEVLKILREHKNYGKINSIQ